ncbi:hypothetical protein GGR52DRAFT_548951 [Hypoxylon sp. FL1284]|nr:hypothetical protein GGR52DRAFT_548951 [Hypoxylon sp. FL1284]
MSSSFLLLVVRTGTGEAGPDMWSGIGGMSCESIVTVFGWFAGKGSIVSAFKAFLLEGLRNKGILTFRLPWRLQSIPERINIHYLLHVIYFSICIFLNLGN